MRKRQRRQSGVGGALVVTAALAGALALAALPNQAWAAVDCSKVTAGSTTDSDGDGLTDWQECNPTLFTFVGGGALPPKCVAGLNRKDCLDPDTKDVFVVAVPAAGSLIIPFPPTAFDPFSGFSPLGITAHLIPAIQIGSDRTLVSGSPQKAVRVKESLDTNGTILGECSQGTPLGLDGCVVYTQRIQNFINSTCFGDTQTARDTALQNYIGHTILHEAGHTLGGLTASYTKNYGGNHYKTGAGYVMDQSVSYTATSTGICTFNISNTWNTINDTPAVKLK